MRLQALAVGWMLQGLPLLVRRHLYEYISGMYQQLICTNPSGRSHLSLAALLLVS
jgi:hypothetical protein